MNRFSSDLCFAQSGENVIEFTRDYFSSPQKKTLLISTLGIQSQSLYFPIEIFSRLLNIDVQIIVEKRREKKELEKLCALHRTYIKNSCGESHINFSDVNIVASDGATIGGRNAVVMATEWFKRGYTDIVIDATGMSRGVCFPLIKQAIDFGLKMKVNVHLLVASSDECQIKLASESSDRAEWMHGFQQFMGLDSTADTFKLWVPQLSESASSQMELMYRALSSSSSVAEVCPIVPFPSRDARRGDELLFEYERDFHGDWDCSHLNVIYAHESNPMDVFKSISKMVAARDEVFTATERKAVTVLSPCGWRIGSLGMLLAAINFDLPMLYVETIGYNVTSPIPSKVEVQEPDHMWHILLTGAPYDKRQ